MEDRVWDGDYVALAALLLWYSVNLKHVQLLQYTCGHVKHTPAHSVWKPVYPTSERHNLVCGNTSQKEGHAHVNDLHCEGCPI